MDSTESWVFSIATVYILAALKGACPKGELASRRSFKLWVKRQNRNSAGEASDIVVRHSHFSHGHSTSHGLRPIGAAHPPTGVEASLAASVWSDRPRALLTL